MLDAFRYTDRIVLKECLRDIGLDKILMDLASKGNCMVHTRWCHSMAGKEYARIYSWGNDPARKVRPLAIEPRELIIMLNPLLSGLCLPHLTFGHRATTRKPVLASLAICHKHCWSRSWCDMLRSTGFRYDSTPNFCLSKKPVQV